MVKKLLAMLCVSAMFFSCLPTVFAEDIVFECDPLPQGGMRKIIGEEIVNSEDLPIYKTYSSTGDDTLYDVIEDGIRQHKPVINISTFRYTNTNENANMILEVLSRVIYENYDLMSFTGYTPVASKGIITGVKPMYLFSSLSEDDAARQAIDDKIDGYIALAKDVPDIEGKVLVIHDAFSKNNEYATEELAVFNEKVENDESVTPDDMVIFTPYGALINNRSVCQGISIALSAIYNKMGIETGICTSEDVDHAWNLVKIDGKWYQLDATWNDPSVVIGKDSSGKNVLSDKCCHDYFLRSDSAFSNHGSRANWEYYITSKVSCTDDLYEDGKIYGGQYIYNGTNYGGWFGNVSFTGGRYVIDVWAVSKYIDSRGGVFLVNLGAPLFYSNKLTSYGAIATEPYEGTNSSGQATNNITIFSNKNIEKNISILAAEYTDSTEKEMRGIKKNTVAGLAENAAITIPFPKSMQGVKLFFWTEDNCEIIKPVCEARKLPTE